MIKNIFRSVSAVICTLILLTFLPINSFAASDNKAKGFDGDVSNCGIYDEKGLFTQSEIDELNEMIQETAEELNLYIAIYLSNTARTETATENFSNIEYENLFAPDTDGVFYYMDLSEQYSAYDYISTSGIGNLYYDRNTDAMLDVIFDYLPASGEPIVADQIYNSISHILGQFEKYAVTPDESDYFHDPYKDTYTYYRDGKVVITHSKPPGFMLRAFLKFALLPSVIIGFLFYLIVKNHYKFKDACSPTAYLIKERTKFNQKEDRFLRTRTIKTKIESSSGGGGGGGGGGSGSHGGGGGHR